ncbi:hypothetical protein DAEQUDRAFT_673200 [Daedalea quercina L-15889]|uniref:Uncharacterized protein n=1 Tax=Daedalea quercina L-15889 TaxID=1314783 RepID=A0A165NW31_9APHY|nr:hypothetical protein DAEQUDRAFT_673200 [Daedalea quercina L-15889]
MVVHIENPHEQRKAEDIANEMIGRRTFIGWPFLQEGMVSAVSDSLFKYEKMAVIPGKPLKVISNPHSQQGLALWKSKADQKEQFYSKRCGVIIGDIQVLVHVRPLKGMKRLDTGAFVKDYEGPDKETEQPVQLTVSEVVSEDPRFMEKDPPPLSEEFPEGSKVFFLGEHAYGVAASVSATTTDTLSVILAFFPSEKAENDKFKSIVDNRMSSRYFPSFRVGDIVGLSGRALSKITSSFMVITGDGQKNNLGLSLKFEAKGLKVIDYSRKDGRYWEFSEKAVDLIREYKEKYPEVMRTLDRGGDAMLTASDVFPGSDADSRVKEVKQWLNSKGIRDFEPVSLFCDQLKKDTVKEIQAVADKITSTKSPGAIKKAMVKGIPRQAILKPAHAVYRLQNQHFALGDRVTMVQDSGSVPLSLKGIVIGMNAKSMDVVWDAPFMAGTTLGDRCSQYRGATVEFTSCLNLTNPQFIASTNPKEPAQQRPSVPFNPRFGPRPAIQAPRGQAGAGFRLAPPTQGVPVHIMTNPNRGRGGFTNGRGKAPFTPRGTFVPPRGTPAGPRGGFVQRGRGGFIPNVSRGRGGPPTRGDFRGGYRGRGRGAGSAANPLVS